MLMLIQTCFLGLFLCQNLTETVFCSLFLHLFSPFLQFHPKFYSNELILQPNMGTSHMQTFRKPVKVSLSHSLLALMTNKSFNTFKMEG